MSYFVDKVVSVQSIGSSAGTVSNTCVITAPTGITIGDLLIAVFNKTSGTITGTPSGFTLFSDFYNGHIYYKIADSGDAAAGSFTFNLSASVSHLGMMYRVQNPNPTTPLGVTSNGSLGADFGTNSFAGVTPTYTESLFISVYFLQQANRTLSSYAMATDNPTWTEGTGVVFDSTNDLGLFTAYAFRSQGTASGSISVSPSGSINNYAGLVLVVNPSVIFSPTVTTQAVSSIDLTTATGNGTVSSDGGATITTRGVCWNTSTTPTISNSISAVSGTTGVFTAPITGLEENTTYYVRAYATNSAGTEYGNEVSFTTLPIADNKVVKDINGVEGETYAVSVNIGGSSGTVTVSLGSTGASQTFAAGVGVVTLQGVYGGLNGLIFTSNSFNGYIDDVMYVLVLGTATIDWDLDTLTVVYPINSSVVFKRIEDKDFNRFRIYRYLDVQFKDLDAYVTVLLKKEANEDLVDRSKEFLVSNVSGEVLPFINKKISTLLKGQAIRVGLSNNNLNETFTVCQFILKGMEQPRKTFDKSKIISV